MRQFFSTCSYMALGASLLLCGMFFDRDTSPRPCVVAGLDRGPEIEERERVNAFMTRIQCDLACGKLSLAEAVQVAGPVYEETPLRAVNELFRGRTLHEKIARNMLLWLREDDQAPKSPTPETLARLEAEFGSLFGSPP